MAGPAETERPSQSARAARRGTWRTFDAADGLAAGVWCLRQDTRGHLWLGTRAGLSRYDGNEFVTYTRDQGLAGDEVMGLCEQEGLLWIGTRDGLSSFDGQSFTSYGVAEGLPDSEIEDVLVDSQGRLWLATHAGAVCYEEGHFRVLTTADGLAGDDVRRIYEDRSGCLWFGTTAGLTTWDGQRFASYTRDDGLAANHVLSVLEDRSGQLWVGTLVGISRRVGERFEAVLPPGESTIVNVRAIHEDRAGRLWFGSIGQGLYCFDSRELVPYGIREGLLGEHVTCVVEDREGHLWIGDGLSGLTCFHADTIEYLTDQPVTEDLCQDGEGRLWFASGNTLCCLEQGELRRRRFGVRLFGVVVDRAQRLWVGTWGEGLLRFDSAEDVFAQRELVYGSEQGLGSEFVAGLLVGADGTLFAGSGYPGCLCRFDGQRFQAIAMPQKVVFRIFQSSDQRIWCAGFSSGGLSCYDGSSLRHFDLADGLPSDAVQSICEDTAGRLWIGTRQGLCAFDGEEFVFYGKEHGFLTLDNQVSVRDRSGQLWFGTKCGVYRWSGRHLQVLTRDDGLPGNSITSLLPQGDGSMVIGTFHGIVRYRPTAAWPPLIEVREVVADQVFRAPEALELTASGAALVTFVYRGLSLGTHRMRYSYCLEGYDRHWHDTWATQVRYEQLPVGDYRFKIQAINRDLVDSETPAEVALRVVVDPWREQQAEYEAELDRMQQLLELHQRTTRQNRALVDLARGEELNAPGLEATLRRVTKVAAQTLGVERASFWRLEESGILRSVTEYDQVTDTWRAGGWLDGSRLPEYMRALEESRSLAVGDCRTDPRTMELREARLEPANTVALLDAPVRLGGRLCGLLCHDHAGQVRHWTVDEQQFVASLADVLALALEAHERRIAEERVRYQAHLLEEVSDAIIAVDLQHRITSWNRAASNLYGWGPDEVVGRPLAEVIPVQIEDTSWDDLWRGLQNHGHWRGEAVHHTRDGRPLNVEWSLSTIGGADGQPLGAVAVNHDITQRKRAEEERRRLEAQIQHAQKLESLGVLAGGIAHDFNNLLMGILGNAGLALIELPPESPARQSVEQIELASQRAAELTRQMLAYSGRGHLEIRPLNLAKLVREMAHLLEVSISKRAVLKYNFDAESATVEGDATQIRQVVMNLITNASDALGDQDGVISVTTGRMYADRGYLRSTFLDDDLPSGDYVFVEVSDTGCGMDEATRGRIFEPFFTTKFTGRGLGLAAVLGIVRGHHGAIKVYSEAGQGTTFKVLLPSSEQRAEDPTILTAEDQAYHGKGTVLVVDDEESVRVVVGRSLEQFGFEVLLAEDGLEALEIFQRQPEAIGLVVLDMTMPRMDGEEAFREMRRIRPDVKVILSSGYNEQEATNRFAGQGLAGFLQKPYGPKKLLEKVREVVGR
ncbi:MAG: response regulator [Armatimonadetes bacterium]|nr:response regulator [Armatimonadota bacterium]